MHHNTYLKLKGNRTCTFIKQYKNRNSIRHTLEVYAKYFELITFNKHNPFYIVIFLLSFYRIATHL